MRERRRFGGVQRIPVTDLSIKIACAKTPTIFGYREISSQSLHKEKVSIHVVRTSPVKTSRYVEDSTVPADPKGETFSKRDPLSDSFFDGGGV
ncbi:hypothetical protein PUN28_006315 [Cardiocondyla obscurior]|uniref:Uncharacterized protein n=1 Tax=Cardiocondyla obscurior TaxID=286306 RepID=A0AAW2GBW2_9HYME